MKKKGKKKGKDRALQKQLEGEERERNAKRSDLALELQMGDTNARLQRRIWRNKMISLNLPIMKEDLEIAWRTFDRVLDNKDYSISILLDAVKSSKEQSRRSDTIHMDQIDQLLKQYKRQLEDYLHYYKTRNQNALDLAHQQIRDLEEEQKEKQNFLRTCTFDTTQRFQRFKEIIRSHMLSKLDTRKEENENENIMYKSLLKNQLQSYLEQHLKVLSDYEERTKDRRKDYNALKNKDNQERKIISQQSLRIQKLYELIHKLKDETIDFRKKSEKEIADYRFERDYFNKAYTIIQNRFKAEQHLDNEQLKIVTIEYNKAMECLKLCVQKIEKVFSMICLCRKYETYNDKFCLYPISTVIDEHFSDNTLIDIKYQAYNIPIEKKAMEKFYRLISVVQKDVILLRNEYDNLDEKTNDLKTNLKKYIDKFTNSGMRQK